MNDDLEATLQDGLLRPPADFTQRVMQRVAAQTLAAPSLGTQMQPLPAHLLATLPHFLPLPSQLPPLTGAPLPAQPAHTDLGHRLRWLAARAGWVGGGLLGLSQLASFVFGLWLSAAAL